MKQVTICGRPEPVKNRPPASQGRATVTDESNSEAHSDIFISGVKL